jgi:hypothetical protein
MAYWSGIAFVVEDLLPVLIGRPATVAAVVPAGDPCIGSGSKCNAVGHNALPFPQRVLAYIQFFERSPTPIVTIEPIGPKKDTCLKIGLHVPLRPPTAKG